MVTEGGGVTQRGGDDGRGKNWGWTTTVMEE